MNTLLARLAFAGFCLSALVGAADADNFLIVPGRSMGQTALGPNGAAEIKRLPPPDAAGYGMMQSRLVWHTHAPGFSDTLLIHGVSNSVFDHVKPAAGMTLDEIRVTSRQFHTQNGVSTVSTLAQVRRRFPDIRPFSGTSSVYGDSQRGIAFEFAQPVLPSSRCLGISVFKPLIGSSGAMTTQAQVDSLLKEERVRR